MVSLSYNWDYFVTTPPAIEPITLAEVKSMLNITGTGDDTLINSMITAVRACAENITGRTFISTGFTTYRNGFSDFYPASSGGECGLALRQSPYLSSAAISYTDTSDAPQTLVLDTDFYVENTNEWSRLWPIDCWPTDVRDRKQDVVITFTAGYGAAASDVPADLRQAMLMHVVDFYNNRGDCDDCSQCMNSQIKSIYKKYKIWGV